MEFTAGIRALPLSIVKVLRGKAFYPTTLKRSGYAVVMPVSTETYTLYAGMLPGGFVEPRKKGRPLSSLGGDSRGSLGSSSADSLVHEIGHRIDYTVLGGYGGFHHPYRFPAFLRLMPEKERIFGKKDGRVPVTDYGYITRYSKTNAQENFAEHFWAFILRRKEFLELAGKEEKEGHPGLMRKYRFMEKLVERTPTTMRRLGRSEEGKKGRH